VTAGGVRCWLEGLRNRPRWRTFSPVRSSEAPIRVETSQFAVACEANKIGLLTTHGISCPGQLVDPNRFIPEAGNFSYGKFNTSVSADTRSVESGGRVAVRIPRGNLRGSVQGKYGGDTQT
jgi:hypothetical protein